MSDSLRQELGQIQGVLSQIQKNTDRIPELISDVRRHDSAIRDITPHVDDYLRNKQRAIGIAAFIALLSAAIGRLTGGH